jgi:hypothetical protein
MISLLLTLAMRVTKGAFWFPPVWPGLFLTWAVMIVRHASLSGDRVGTLVFSIGNSLFYVWFSYRVFKAEMLSRGAIGRILFGHY